jgi:hypothetical protein
MIKTPAKKLVLSRKANIRNASSLLSASKGLKVVLMEYTEAEVNEVKSQFSEAWLNKTVKLK